MTAPSKGASPSVLLGVDAGGSHTAAAISRADFAILGRADGPGAPMRPSGAEATAAVVAEVAGRAARVAGITLPTERAVVGAAGAGRAQERHELRVALAAYGLARAMEVVADGEIGLAAAFGTEPGILISAGTGSIAYARDRQGRLRRAGGYGWQLGDAGGGYWIGRQTLAAAARARDGLGDGSALLPRLLAALGLHEFDDLVRWAATAPPAQVAALATPLLNAARDAVPAAQHIVANAATALVELVRVVEAMFPPDDGVQVATAGGLLVQGSPLYEAFCERLASTLPQVRVSEDVVDPPLGALRLAAELR